MKIHDIANKKNKKKIILIFVRVEATNTPPNVNKRNEGSPHAARGLNPAVVEQRMTAESRCWGGVSHPLQLTTGLVIKSITTSPTLAGEHMLFILQVSILSEQIGFSDVFSD